MYLFVHDDVDFNSLSSFLEQETVQAPVLKLLWRAPQIELRGKPSSVVNTLLEGISVRVDRGTYHQSKMQICCFAPSL
jgi:hypothetical protein